MKLDLSLEECAKNLVKHGFEVEIVPTVESAGKRLRSEISSFSPHSISYGDSLTVRATGIVEELNESKNYIFYDGFDKNVSREERIEKRRQGIIADLFFTGVNAVSITGSLHWLDMVGNRIAPVAFGPKRIILLVGKNKLVENEVQAEKRLKEIAAPLNAARHPDFHTPCIKTGKCMECNSPQRICNAKLSLERCFPKGRILVLLIEEDAGL